MLTLVKPERQPLFGAGLFLPLLAEEKARLVEVDGQPRELNWWYKKLIEEQKLRIALLDESPSGWPLRYVFGSSRMWEIVTVRGDGVLDFDKSRAVAEASSWQLMKRVCHVVVVDSRYFNL